MKKIKLFLSLCMMCLCVAVLCIGVLAFSSAIYNINGNISYNMTADLAKINTRVYRVAEKSTEDTLTSNVATLSTMTYAQIERYTTTTYIEHQRLSTLNAISVTDTQEQYSSEAISMTFGEIENEDECYYTYYIVVSIVNKSTDGTLTATLTDTIESDTTFYRYTNAELTGIANGEIKNIVIGISKIDDTEITTQTFTYTLNVSYVAWFDLNLSNDVFTVGSFKCMYGVKWRELYKINGYNEGVLRIHGNMGAMYVIFTSCTNSSYRYAAVATGDDWDDIVYEGDIVENREYCLTGCSSLGVE